MFALEKIFSEYTITMTCKPGGDKKHRILVVEDETNAAHALQLLLEHQGHTVATVATGDQALERSKAFMPNVVICDINLPGKLDGYAVGSSLRALRGLESVHLVAMTGYATEQDQERTKRAGFEYHLIKPVSIENLCALLADIDK